MLPSPRHRLASVAVPMALVIGLLAGLAPQTARAANCAGLPVTGGAIPSGTYTLADDCAITATLVIGGGTTVTIDGAGFTISGGGFTRVLLVQSEATLNLDNVTIADGAVPSDYGGGIRNDGTLTIADSTVSGNNAFGGGGIRNFRGSLLIANSTVSSNSAGAGGGGGIYNQAGLIISNSTISNNSANVGGGIFAGTGGAVTVTNSSFSGNTALVASGGGIGGFGPMEVSATTFSDNRANSSGGGIHDESGALTVSDSTFAGNSAFNGGGISNGGTLVVASSTFSGNASLNDGAGIWTHGTLGVTNSTLAGNGAANLGGGIHNRSDGAVTITNSTLLGNSASVDGGGIRNIGVAHVRNTIVADSPSGGNCSGSGPFTQTTSMADDATCPGFSQVTLADLNLGPLTGSPAYFPLLPGSVAIDAGDDSVCPSTDQPGNPRPLGTHCDMGAFEASGNQPPLADAGGPYVVDEGAAVALAGSGTDPDGDALTFAWDLDDDGIFETDGQNVTFSAAGRDGPDSRTVVVRACDPLECATDSATVDILNVAPEITAILAPADPVQVGTPITATGAFSDPGTPDTHTAVWDWGDGTTSPGTVDPGAAKVSDADMYTQPGVFTLTLTVTDDDGGSDTGVFEFVVVYDPDGAFVTGGGWIWSEPAFCTLDAACHSAQGQATFGFVSKYHKGASVPSGQTQFQFNAGGLSFHSTAYEWLVVAGPQAQYKGSGTVNGAGDFGFLLTARDSALDGGPGTDTLRIKIWDRSTDDVVYDNGTDQEIGGGSIVIHP